MPDSDPSPILVALDPELPAEGAERLARTLAGAHGTGVVLATVFPLVDLHTRVNARHFERLLREEADRFLAGRAERWRAESPDITVHTRTVGSPSAARGLHRLARESGAAMVVVGPSRRHGAGLTFPGPMAIRFAHAAPCPVVVATGRIPERLDRIGAGFVPADDGRVALRAAAALAERCGATLRAISVAGPLPWMDVVQPEFDGATLPELFAGHLAFELAHAVDALPAGLAVEVDTLAGNPGGGPRRSLGRARPPRVRLARARAVRRGRARQHVARPARGRAVPGAARPAGGSPSGRAASGARAPVALLVRVGVREHAAGQRAGRVEGVQRLAVVPAARVLVGERRGPAPGRRRGRPASAPGRR